MRAHYQLYPPMEPAALLHASTLLLLRDAAQGSWEVLMTRRAETASFAPGAYVFPGGGIEAQDALADSFVLAREDMPVTQRTAAIAAARESWEELGVLLAAQADGRAVNPAEVAELDRRAALWPQLSARGWKLDIRDLWQLAHWTADRGLARRFAVPFWVARMPQGQMPVADEREQFAPQWVHPQQALAQYREGRMPMIFPTLRTLERLCIYPSAQSVLDAAAHGPLWVSTPRTGLLDGQEWRCMEGDAAFGELALVCPQGQVQHALDWRSDQAVPLRRNVLRLTAPNAGLMTGPGTNSYLVGETSTGFIAIDPGPADAAHVRRVWEAAGGDVRYIVCTHSHADHAPGAGLLQQLCVQQGQQRPLIYGLPSASTARPDSHFVPDVVLHDQARLVLSGQGSNAVQADLPRHTVRAIFTPGHAANHLCLLLEEDALLFSGDHILNGSTTIVDLPDGNMLDYMDSLDKLAALCQAEAVEFLLPAHGYVLGDAPQVIARLKAHRLARESKVRAAMQQLPLGSARDWVALAYTDTPQALWKLAERSLLAHVERIRALGLHHVSD